MASPKAPQTPYLGSRISLISKAEIRYEGILYTVDTTEQTIALAKVKSYGTEDRPTDNPVPARDEVFEYIIFKATDIKDLIVRETPKPVPTLAGGLPYDPAIVSVSQHPATDSRSGTPANIAQSAASLHGAAAAALRSPTAEGAQSAGQMHQGMPPQHGNKAYQPPGPGGPMPPYNRARSPGRGGFGGFTNGQRGGAWGPSVYNRGTGYRGGYLAAMGGGAVSYRQAAMAQQRGPPPPPMGQRGGWRGAFYPPHGPPPFARPPRGGMRGAGGRPMFPQKFDSEYDFEKANEQFQETLKISDTDSVQDKLKTKIEDGAKSDGDADKADGGDKQTDDVQHTVGGGSPILGVRVGAGGDGTDPCYDKSKSFFDRISCEALERETGNNNRQRVNWRREREINAETFGPQALRNYFARRGGMNMRGGFYRGGHRGFYRGGPPRGQARY